MLLQSFYLAGPCILICPCRMNLDSTRAPAWQDTDLVLSRCLKWIPFDYLNKRVLLRTCGAIVCGQNGLFNSIEDMNPTVLNIQNDNIHFREPAALNVIYDFPMSFCVAGVLLKLKW